MGASGGSVLLGGKVNNPAFLHSLTGLPEMAAPPPIYAHHYPYYDDPYYAALPVPPGESLAVHHNLVERDHGKISTLFVAGLPDDVKPREVHNLFSRRPGFESCLLEFTGKGNQVTLFFSLYFPLNFTFVH